MDRGPLVREEIDAGEILAREFDKYVPLKAAFWLKASDEDQRYLYLTSDRLDDSNRFGAYGELIRLANVLKLPDLDPFRVKIIAGKHPLAVAAADLVREYPNATGRRFGGQTFGDLHIDDGYVYPQLLPVAA